MIASGGTNTPKGRKAAAWRLSREAAVSRRSRDRRQGPVGNLLAAARADFNRHMGGCPHRRSVVDENSDIGLVIKNLPLHVESPGDLEERKVAAMVAALAEGRAEPGSSRAAAAMASPSRPVCPHLRLRRC